MSAPRIAYLLKKFPRLSETFVLNEILEQERRGAEVHVFSRRAPDDEPRHAELGSLRAEVELLPRKHALDPWGDLFAAPGGPVAALEPISSILADAQAWEHPRLSELLAEALHLVRRTRELGIDHVHVHFATDSAITAMLLSRLGGPGYSVTMHAKDIYRTAIRTELLDRIVADSRFCVTVCDANVRHLEGMLGEHALGKLRRLYNGIDLRSFATIGEACRARNRILSVGRLVEKKGFDVLLEALGILRDRGVDFEALVLGDGEDRDELVARRDRLALGDRVQFGGAVPQDAIRRELLAATVFCLPCVIGRDGNRDALPTVLLEAQASGLPAVSTPVTGIPEILDGGRAGLIVPERDPTATADALEGLLADGARRSSIAAAGRRRVRELFDLSLSGDVLHGWFERAVREVACA